MYKRTAKLLALLSVTGLAAAQCAAAPISLLDTIGDGSKFQLNREVVKTVEVGFESHPASGLFTGLRPVFHVAGTPDHNAYVSAPWEFGVSEKGTSGVPIETRNSAWVAQPFTAKVSGYVYGISLIAQNKRSAGYSTETADAQKNIRAKIMPVSGLSNPISVSTDWGSIPFGSAGVGKIVSGSAGNVQIMASQQYVLVVGIEDQVTSNCHAKLNWAWDSQVNDNTYVDSLQQSFGGTQWYTLPGRALAFKLEGYESPIQNVKAGELGNHIGQTVRLSGVAINGKGGAIPGTAFYVEDVNRVCGVRVEEAPAFPEGELLDITGTVVELANGELAIDPDYAPASLGNDPVAPVFVVSKALENGPKLTGMLVKVAGNVVSPAAAGVFTINDGYTDIKCVGVAGWANLPATAGNPIQVTGVVSLDSAGAPQILIRANTDIIP